jgi:shikimate dehydrogenase
MGLLGYQTQYSLSPTIHNACFRDLGLNLAYLNFDLEGHSLATFFDSFIALGGRYLNVTKPYKNTVASLVGLGPGTYNTLTYDVEQKRWAGTSTDGVGFLKSWERFDINFVDLTSVIIFGFGGSVQSILDELGKVSDVRNKQIFIVVRQPDKAKKEWLLLKESQILNVIFVAWSIQGVNSFSTLIGLSPLVIQGSSAPSQGDRLEQFSFLIQGRRGYLIDLIYDHPSQIYFEAMNSGWSVQDGMTMLIEQARASQKFWWGKSASYEIIYKAIKDTGRLLA